MTKIINNNEYKYVNLNQDICDALELDFGDFVKVVLKGKSAIITKINQEQKKEVNLEAREYNLNSAQEFNSNSSKSNSKSLLVTQDQIQTKILDIIDQSQVISLSELISKVNIEDKELLVSVLRNMIENNEIIGSEQDDDLYFSLKIK